jgi:hypothetical protein
MASRSDLVAIVLPGLCGDAVCSPLELLARSWLGSARLPIPVAHTLDCRALRTQVWFSRRICSADRPSHELRLSRTGQRAADRGRSESQVPLLRERRREIRGQSLWLGRSCRSRARGFFCPHGGYVDDLLRRAHLRRVRIRPPVPGREVDRVNRTCASPCLVSASHTRPFRAKASQHVKVSKALDTSGCMSANCTRYWISLRLLPVAFAYKLELEDGTPADPPTLDTAVSNWKPGPVLVVETG